MKMSSTKQLIFDNYIATTFDGYHQSGAKLKEFRLNFTRLLPPVKSAASLLDIGVGRGEMLSLWKEMGYQNITGIDIGREPVEFCRDFIWPNVILVDASHKWLSQHRNEFDLITAIDVVEHIEKTSLFSFMEGVREALKPGGTFLARVPNLASPSGLVARYHDITHELGFTENSFSQVLRLAGFRHWHFCAYEEPLESLRAQFRLVLRDVYYACVRLLRQLEHAYNPRILTPAIVIVARI